MRFTTYSVGNEVFYGAVTDTGMIALNDAFPQWKTLRDVIAASGLGELERFAASTSITHSDFTYEIPIPDPGKLSVLVSIFPIAMQSTKTGVISRNICHFSLAFPTRSPGTNVL